MKIIKAVVGVLRNKSGQLLIAKRQDHQFMPGYWELPGGKVEKNESEEQAVIRELKEELGVQINKLALHQTMQHQYTDRIIKLSIYNINEFNNTPAGLEGQEITWSDVEDLYNYQLLPTMKSFIDSITLPNKYWITPSLNHTSSKWLDKFEQKLNSDITLIQLRSKSILDSLFIAELNNKCKQNNIKLLLNTPNKTFDENHCDGWHITTGEMLELDKRPCAEDKLLGASTHNLEEAFKAQEIGADFIVISPVQATQTHPDAAPLGWDKAKEVVDKLNIPVFFLGGMGLADLEKTLELGAQGIAGVSAF